ncbi:tetratricopeptide repeat protein [Candidatus Neomarinimicrobiota bacterium]
MPVCITGMHRSGTSMIARMLNLCGLYLGAEEKIMPADAGNPTGYWQNLEMDQISEAILANFSGGWDFLLPVMASGWEHQDDLNVLRTKAQSNIARMETNKPWGWKDPRACLTIPFWKSLLPELKVVVCLRNPIEVVDSLHKHTGSTTAFTYNLWIRYYQRILEDVSKECRIITHYDSYFSDPGSELDRLLNWLGWEVATKQAEQAQRFISSKHRNHTLVTTDLLKARVPMEVVEIYETLCSEAGEILQTAFKNGILPRLKPQEVIGLHLPERDTTSPEIKEKAAATFNAAHTLIAENNLSEALDALELVVSLYPYHVQAQNDLGVLCLASGDHDRAVAHLNLAMRLNPDNPDTMKNLTEALMQAGRIEDAIQTMLDLVYRQPEDIEALYWLGTACESQGQLQAARELFSRIQQLRPEHPGASQRLAALENDPPSTP